MPRRSVTKTGFGRTFLIFSSLTALAATLIRLRTLGFSATDAFSIEGIFRAGNAISIARYSGDIGGNSLTAALLAISYAGALAGPFIMQGKGHKDRLYRALPLLSTLVYSTLTTERLALLIVATFYSGGALYAFILTHGHAPQPNLRRIMHWLLGVVVVAILFMAIAFVRVGSYSAEYARALEEKFAVYAFGYLGGFSAWEQRYSAAPPSRPTLGSSSLAGLGQLFGVESKSASQGHEFLPINASGTTTNVYTYLRDLITDFTIPGALIALLLIGAIAQAIFRKVVVDASPTAAVFGGASVGTILLSANLTTLIFTNYVLAVAVALAAVRYALSPPSG